MVRQIRRDEATNPRTEVDRNAARFGGSLAAMAGPSRAATRVRRPQCDRPDRHPLRRAELQLKALLDHAGEEAAYGCCCHPVAFIMASIDAPEGCRSRARTASCLVPPRAR